MIFKNNAYKKIASAVMSALLVMTMPVQGFAAEPKDSGAGSSYDEAYYVTTDYYGNLLQGSIVKSYVLNGNTKICDYGRYEGVHNLTDSTAAETIGSKTVFNLGDSSEEHFYFEAYTGEPYKTLPWDISVRYELNGVAVKAEELAGRTGVVEIFIDAVPNENASSYERNNFSLASTALFNQDDILSLEAEGAQVQMIGNLRAALFIALPGEEQHVSIRVGSDNFQFGGMTFMMTPVTLSQLSELSKLQERKDELESDYRKLSDSLDNMLDSLNTISGSLNASANGLDEIDQARRTFSDGKDSIYGSVDALKEELTALQKALEPLSSDLAEGSEALSGGLDILSGVNRDLKTLKADLKELENSVSSVGTSAKPVAEDISEVLTKTQSDSEKLQEDLSALENLKMDPVEELDAAEISEGISSALDENGLPAPSDIDPDAAEKLNETVTELNGQIAVVNGVIDKANGTVDKLSSESSELLESVGRLSSDTKNMIDGVNSDAAAVKGSAGDLAEDARQLISGCNKLYAHLENYEPKAEQALSDMQQLSSTAAEAVGRSCELIDSVEGLMKDSGSQLDKGAADSLHALAGALRSTASALSNTDDIREAKDTVSEIIEDTWEEYTGQVNNLLNLDANARMQSLTDPRNPEPSSVQVMIRTQEIKAEKNEAPAPAEQAAVKTTFFERVHKMISDIAAFILRIFKR